MHLKIINHFEVGTLACPRATPYLLLASGPYKQGRSNQCEVGAGILPNVTGKWFVSEPISSHRSGDYPGRELCRQAREAGTDALLTHFSQSDAGPANDHVGQQCRSLLGSAGVIG